MNIGAGILPYTYINNDTYYLFGLDKSTGLYSDFGGRCERNDTNNYTCAIREMQEETLSIISPQELFINLNTIYKVNTLYYVSYLMYIQYKPYMITMYNRIIQYLQNKINDKYIEKIEMKWFSKKEMRNNIHKFRKHMYEIINNI